MIAKRKRIIVKEHPMQESRTRADVSKGKDPKLGINELIEGMSDLQLKFVKLEKGERSGIKSKPNEGEKSVLRIELNFP